MPNFPEEYRQNSENTESKLLFELGESLEQQVHWMHQ
jgi:hypothetical protein